MFWFTHFAVFSILTMMCIVNRLAIASTDMRNLNMKARRGPLSADNIGFNFTGNQQRSDHFKLLEVDGTSLLIGARDAVYNLSLGTLDVQKKLDWPSTPGDIELCIMKGKTAEECHNYIRVLVKESNNRVLVCGTNAFKPMCRVYEGARNGEFQVVREFNGYAISPYDPKHNSTAYYDRDTKELYAGTVSDFASSDPLIYRKPLTDTPAKGAELRTPRNDLKVLNEPHFVSSMADKDQILFWFREAATEYSLSNCGRSNFARVARVCRRDRGGPRYHSDTWTSFLKARLNCSIPGDQPFFFNELQATSAVVKSDRGDLVYAVLTTPWSEIRASAVCAFSLDSIRKIFDNGTFLVQSSMDALWLPVPKSNLPSPRPGSCVDDSTRLPDDVINFVKRNALMDDTVDNAFDQPLAVDTQMRSRYTQIAVYPQVPAAGSSEQRYDVMFVGTDDGRILKMVNVKSAAGGVQRTVLIEDLQVFTQQSVVNLLLHNPPDSNDIDAVLSEPRLIVVSENSVRSLPVHTCYSLDTCERCVRVQDPFCAWNLEAEKCEGRTRGGWPGSAYVQDIDSGSLVGCPGYKQRNPDYEVNVEPGAESLLREHQGRSNLIYTEGMMAIAVVITLALASTAGFLAGYRFSLSRHTQGALDGASSAGSSGSTYDPASGLSSTYGYGHAVGTFPRSKYAENLDIYAQPPPYKRNCEAVNLVLSLPDAKSAEKIGTPQLGATPMLLNNGTLPKDYKAKKVYL